jgi:Co/Zn/Cd efflux system component
VVRRFISGEPPEGAWMMAVAAVALAVNATVLRLLSKQRQDEIHIRATWIFTRADVVANIAVILSGLAVLATGIRYFDLAVGAAIGIYVAKEALEILKEAREAK